MPTVKALISADQRWRLPVGCTGHARACLEAIGSGSQLTEVKSGKGDAGSLSRSSSSRRSRHTALPQLSGVAEAYDRVPLQPRTLIQVVNGAQRSGGDPLDANSKRQGRSRQLRQVSDRSRLRRSCMKLVGAAVSPR